MYIAKIEIDFFSHTQITIHKTNYYLLNNNSLHNLNSKHRNVNRYCCMEIILINSRNLLHPKRQKQSDIGSKHNTTSYKSITLRGIVILDGKTLCKVL